MDTQNRSETDFSGHAEEDPRPIDGAGAPLSGSRGGPRRAILWEQGFGWADRENRIPATAPYDVLSGLHLQTLHDDRFNAPCGAG